ncbi:MAG: hypothetical protein ABJG68_13220 [Crocinitomicaceae bacterium]
MRLFVFTMFISSTLFAGVQPKVAIGSLSYKHFPPTQTYQEALNIVSIKRGKLKSSGASAANTRTYFLDAFENDIFPHWVGTSWDYNGYTNTPGKGKLVACGYFVSTPLKHMGFNWNRFKLAQMYSKKIAETLCTDVTKYTNQETMLDTIKNRENHLYIVGLDSHVGMILKTDHGLWFVHSNYYGNEGPVKEIAAESQALDDSGSYYLGTFSSDENMRNWLSGKLYPTE